MFPKCKKIRVHPFFAPKTPDTEFSPMPGAECLKLFASNPVKRNKALSLIHKDTRFFQRAAFIDRRRNIKIKPSALCRERQNIPLGLLHALRSGHHLLCILLLVHEHRIHRFFHGAFLLQQSEHDSSAAYSGEQNACRQCDILENSFHIHFPPYTFPACRIFQTMISETGESMGK